MSDPPCQCKTCKNCTFRALDEDGLCMSCKQGIHRMVQLSRICGFCGREFEVGIGKYCSTRCAAQGTNSKNPWV